MHDFGGATPCAARRRINIPTLQSYRWWSLFSARQCHLFSSSLSVFFSPLSFTHLLLKCYFFVCIFVIVWLWLATIGPRGCSAAPPPTGVGRRIERKRQKRVGRDKGSSNRTANKRNSNNNNTDKENTQNK